MLCNDWFYVKRGCAPTARLDEGRETSRRHVLSAPQGSPHAAGQISSSLDKVPPLTTQPANHSQTPEPDRLAVRRSSPLRVCGTAFRQLAPSFGPLAPRCEPDPL